VLDNAKYCRQHTKKIGPIVLHEDQDGKTQELQEKEPRRLGLQV
jgi:hypothetical protein